MRSTTLACLVALGGVGGCNWVFGLDKTNTWDAAPAVPDAPDAPDAAIGPFAQITWFDLTSSPADSISFPAIDQLIVKAGPMDGPLQDMVIDATGGFHLPYGIADHPYRIVYQLPGDSVPHELQWQIATGVHFTLPLYGSLPRTAPSTGTSYSLSKPNSNFTCTGPNCVVGVDAYVTGRWLVGGGGYHPLTGKTIFPLPTYASMTGALSTPMAGTRDVFVAVHYTAVGDPRTIDSYLYRLAPDPVDGADEDLGGQTGWTTPTTGADTTSWHPQTLDTATQISTALGTLGGTISLVDKFGVMPTFAVPSLIVAPNKPGAMTDGALISFQTITAGTGNSCIDAPNPFLAGMTQDARPPAALYRQYATRAAGSTAVQLYSGIEYLIDNVKKTQCGSPSYATTTTIGMATSASFGVPLTTDGRAVSLPTNGYQDLTFSLDSATNTTDCETTLFHIDNSGGALVPLRSFRTLAKAGTMAVHVPTSDFMTGLTYVFGIACNDTYSTASIGDYTHVRGAPWQQSQIFPGTFVVTLN